MCLEIHFSFHYLYYKRKLWFLSPLFPPKPLNEQWWGLLNFNPRTSVSHAVQTNQRKVLDLSKKMHLKGHYIFIVINSSKFVHELRHDEPNITCKNCSQIYNFQSWWRFYNKFYFKIINIYKKVIFFTLMRSKSGTIWKLKVIPLLPA